MKNIIERLGIRITDKSEIPKSFDAITVPIPMAEEAIVESIWSSLRTTDALVTMSGQRLQLWRKQIIKSYATPDVKGFVKTR